MKKTLLCTLGAVLSATLATKAQNNVGINTSTPDVSAALEVKSTTQGMLIPRMTKAQRDVINMVAGTSTPATGLLIYQTDDTPGFYFYNGSLWATLNSGSANTTIADGAVTTEKIADNAVTTAKIADAAIGMNKLNTTGAASGNTFLRGDGSWVSLESSVTNTTMYAAKKSIGVALSSYGTFPLDFKPVNFLVTDRTIGSAALFSNTENTYIIPSTGVYKIGFSFRYGSGIQGSILSNSPGIGIARTRSGVSTIIDSRTFASSSLGSVSITISEASISSMYSFQAGDRIALGLVGSSSLDAGQIGMSTTNFFIYKISN